MIEGMARDRDERRRTLDLGNGKIRRYSIGQAGREGSGRWRGKSETRKKGKRPPTADNDLELMYDEKRGFYHNERGWWDSRGKYIPYNQSDLSVEEFDRFSPSMPKEYPPPPPVEARYHY